MNTNEDLNDDVNYINGLFNSFGMEEFPFKSIFDNSDVIKSGNKYMILDNKARVCSLLIQLLHSKQKEEIFRKDSEDRIIRLMDEIHNLEAHQKRQDERVRLQERELTGQRQNQQLFNEKQRQMESSAHSLREELSKLKQLYSQKERQFQHELRKKEKEFEKLKDQLAAVLKDMQLREQKSEIHYNPQQTVPKENPVEEEMENEDEVTIGDRVNEIEGENDRLRQIISFTYGNLVQLVVDLFPELEIDQSILGLLETSPLVWIEDHLANKTEELFEILRDNLASLAIQQQNSRNKEHEEILASLNSQLQSLNLTVASQNNTIKSLEQQLKQMEEYRLRTEALESEKTRFQELLNINGRIEQTTNENLVPGTPKWMKSHAKRSRSRSFSPDSSDFGNSPIKSARGRSPSNSPVRSPARNSASYLALSNLTRNVNEGHLKEIFGVYGEIISVVYPMHPNTGYPTGRAVIHYKETVSVESALKGMHGGQIDGIMIECHVSKYPEPMVKFNRGVREPRHRGNRNIHGRIDHYVPVGRRNRSKTPVRRSRSPIRRRLSRSPLRPGRRFSPKRYSPSRPSARRVFRSPIRSPRRYSRSPRRGARSPRRYSRSPRRISASPRRYSRSTRSPPRHVLRSRSPVRRFSRSPMRRSPSPRYRRRSSLSRSPIRHISPSYNSRSRSPPSRSHHDGPPRHIDRSPKRFSPRRSPSRSPIPVSRMNY